MVLVLPPNCEPLPIYELEMKRILLCAAFNLFHLTVSHLFRANPCECTYISCCVLGIVMIDLHNSKGTPYIQR